MQQVIPEPIGQKSISYSKFEENIKLLNNLFKGIGAVRGSQ